MILTEKKLRDIIKKTILEAMDMSSMWQYG